MGGGVGGGLGVAGCCGLSSTVCIFFSVQWETVSGFEAQSHKVQLAHTGYSGQEPGSGWGGQTYRGFKGYLRNRPDSTWCCTEWVVEEDQT